MFFPDRSLSREILFPSTNFLSAQSPFEDGIRESLRVTNERQSVLKVLGTDHAFDGGILRVVFLG